MGNDPFERNHRHDRRTHQHSLGLAQQREAIDRLEVGKQSLTALLYTGHTLSSSGDRKGPTLKDLAPTFGGQRRDIQRVLHTIEQAQQQLAVGAALPGVARRLEGVVGKAGLERLLPRNLFGDLVDEALVARSEASDRRSPAAAPTGKKDPLREATRSGTPTLFKGLPWAGDAAKAARPLPLTSHSEVLTGKPSTAQKATDRERDKRLKDTKAKFAAAIGHGFNPDGTTAIQALLELAPDELRALVEDPDMNEVFRRMTILGSKGDVTRIRAMATSTSKLEMTAHALLWAFQGGRLGAGYDDKLFKSVVDKLSDDDRKVVDRELTKLSGMSVTQLIDSEAWLSSQNNRMLKAYWKGQGAAIGEELQQAANGGWLREAADLVRVHGIVSGHAGLSGVVADGIAKLGSIGTNQEAYVAQLDKLRELTEPPPNATQQQRDELDQKRRLIVSEIDAQLKGHGLTLQEMNRQEASDPANQVWMKKNLKGGRDDAFARMLEAARVGDWTAYSQYKAAYGVETTLGNRTWTHQELERQRKRGTADHDRITGFLGRRSESKRFEAYVEEQGGSDTDRAYLKTLGKQTEEGSDAWIDEQAQRLLYAQFGGRTGWGDDRASIEKIVAELPREHRDRLVARYRQLAEEQGLTGAPAMQEGLPGPLKYMMAQHWIGNWSSGDLAEDLKLSYGADLHDATAGLFGKGRGYTQVEYDLQNGKATNPEQQMRRAAHMRRFDTTSGLLGTLGMGVSGKIADDRYAELEEAYRLLRAMGLHDGRSDADSRAAIGGEAVARFNDASELSDAAANGANATQRGIVDGVMTVYTGTATILITTAITVVTAGAATPAIVAAVSAAGAGLAAMGVKRIVLGGKYSGNDARMDFASTIIDAFVAGVLDSPMLEELAVRLGKRFSHETLQRLVSEAVKSEVQLTGELTKALLDEAQYQASPEQWLAQARARLGTGLRGSAAGVALKAHKPAPTARQAAVQAVAQAGVQLDPNQTVTVQQVAGVTLQGGQGYASVKNQRLGARMATDTEPRHATEGSADRPATGDVPIEARTTPATDAKTDTKTDTKADTKAEAKTEAKTEGKTEAKTEGTTDAKTDAKTEAKTVERHAPSQAISPHRARDMAEFRQVYGEKVTVYRGIRLAPGEPVIGTYASGNDEGQMVIPNNIRAAAHYAVNPQYTSKAEVARRSEIVIVKFEITANEVGRPAGGWEHIILRSDVDITKLPGYAVVLRQPVAGFDQYAVRDPDVVEQQR